MVFMYKEVRSYLLGFNLLVFHLLGFNLLVFHLLGFNLLYNKVLIYIQGYNIIQGKKKKRVVIYTKCYYMFLRDCYKKKLLSKLIDKY